MSVLLVVWFGLVAQASAATIDFAQFDPGNRGPVAAFPHGLVVETTGGSIIVYDRDAARPGLCARAIDGTCRGDLTIIFFGPVSDLAFTFDPKVPASSVAVTLYDGETIMASGGAVGAAAPLGVGEGGITQARLTFASLPSTVRSGGGSLRGIAYTPTTVPLADIQTAALAQGAPGNRPPVQTEALDFTKATPLGTGNRSIRVPGATVSLLTGDKIFLYEGGEFGLPSTGGFCALAVGFRCLGDTLIVFDTLIRDLSFSTFFYKPGDLALVRLFSGDRLVTERSVARAGIVSFFGIVGISHVEILDRSQLGSKGFAYGDFRYSIYEPPLSVVPVPSSGVMLATSLALVTGAGFGIRRARRKAEPLT